MFKFTVTANSEAELNFRIEDNIKRGFKLIKMIEPEFNTFRDKYIHSKYTEFPKRESSSYQKFQAIMGK